MASHGLVVIMVVMGHGDVVSLQLALQLSTKALSDVSSVTVTANSGKKPAAAARAPSHPGSEPSLSS